MGAKLTKLCKNKGVEIIEGRLMVDHVYILVFISPKYNVLNFIDDIC